MTSQFKSNNFIAILIALMLFAGGFLLYFIHEQSESDEKSKKTKKTTTQSIEIIKERDLILVNSSMTSPAPTRPASGSHI